MSRRLAVVFPFPLLPLHRGKDLMLIPMALEREGWSVELLVPEAEAGTSWPIEVHAVGADALRRPSFYAERGLDAVLAYSFLHFSDILQALRAAGVRVVAKGDTAGASVVRVHPRDTFVHARHDQPTRAGRAVSLLAWGLRLGPLAGRDARELERVLELADVTIVETQAAFAAVTASLARRGRAELATRLAVVPNPLASVFLEHDVPVDRDAHVVAIGRWDVAAKGAPLLGRALERFLERHPDHRATVVGMGGDERFSSRCERPGQLTPEAMAELLARARFVVTGSHWESFSLSSHEALAMGCTVVGPPLAPLRDMAAVGHATLATRRSPEALAVALAEEAGLWARNARDPKAIADHWRRRLDARDIARRVSALLSSELPSS